MPAAPSKRVRPPREGGGAQPRGGSMNDDSDELRYILGMVGVALATLAALLSV
jgi:hypothetical protein